MATYTASLYSNSLPKQPHVGVTGIVVNYQSGTLTSSSGDIIFLAKIPHGARVLEVIEDHSTDATAHAIDIGLATGGTAGGGASFSAFIAAGAQATKNRLSKLGIPAVVSVSDGDPNRYGILAAKCAVTGTATVSLHLNVAVLYTCDGVT